MAGESELAGIEYHGISGASEECENAVLRLLQYGERIPRTRILSFSNHHCLLLENGIGDTIAIKSGFASGYGGSGPTRFSRTLQLLVFHDSEIDECKISEPMLQRLDNSALTKADLKRINATKPIRPHRWFDYIFEDDFEKASKGTLWRNIRPVMPFAIIDSRIVDLALSFWENPDDKLLRGYRRLEDMIRRRIRSESHGTKLFSEAFSKRESPLKWRGLTEGEQIGRANLFSGAYMAYRNPQAHREMQKAHDEQLAEFLLLNHLYRLEAEARSVSNQIKRT